MTEQKLYSEKAVAGLIDSVHRAETFEDSASTLIGSIQTLIAKAAKADGVDTTAADSELGALMAELDSKTDGLSAAITANVPEAVKPATVPGAQTLAPNQKLTLITGGDGQVVSSVVEHADSSNVSDASKAALDKAAEDDAAAKAAVDPAGKPIDGQSAGTTAVSGTAAQEPASSNGGTAGDVTSTGTSVGDPGVAAGTAV